MGYLEKIKKWDLVAAQRPDKIISISETVKERCKKYYKRESEVIYPGFDVGYWRDIRDQISHLRQDFGGQAKIQKYFLVVSRLEPYKKIDFVIKVFNKLNKSLIIVGEGTEETKLKQIAGDNITFLSKLSDVELGNLYLNAQALVMPQEEDFGYVSLEAQFFSCPIIAYEKGGSKETIVDGETGIFFEDQNEQSLRSAIERFHKIEYNLRTKITERGIKTVESFKNEIFIKNFVEFVKNC